MAVTKFGHHQDPAQDFLEEVRQIEEEYGRIALFSLKPDDDYRLTLQTRIAKAMGFRVGGVLECIEAKNRLRHVEILGQLGISAHGMKTRDLVKAMMSSIGLNMISPDITVCVGGNLHPTADEVVKKTAYESVVEAIKKYEGSDRPVTVGVDLAAPGSDETSVTTWVHADFHRAREKELLTANNKYLERARKAEARVRELEASSASVMPSLTKLIDERIRRAMLDISRQPRR